MPKQNQWLWVDIWNCLYRERIIFLSKAVDDELGNQLVATMLYLDSENKKDLNLYINCSGGEVMPCLALADTMRHIKSDVGTVGFGGAMGMPGFLLAVGKKVRRAGRVCMQREKVGILEEGWHLGTEVAGYPRREGVEARERQ